MKVDQAEEKSAQKNALSELIEQFLTEYSNGAGPLPKPDSPTVPTSPQLVQWHDTEAANAASFVQKGNLGVRVRLMRSSVSKTMQNLLSLRPLFAKFFSADALLALPGQPLSTWLSGFFQNFFFGVNSSTTPQRAAQ